MKESAMAVDGVAIRYLEEGSGVPLLLIHGNMGSSRWFEKTMRVPGCRAVALDMPNFGGSGPFAGAADIDRYADAVAAFAEALRLERPLLLGHSLGGAVAISLAVRWPARWRGLVLADSAAPSGFSTPVERHPAIEAMRTDRAFLAKAIGAVVPAMRDEAFLEALVDDARRMAAPAWIGNAEALSRFDYGGRCGAYDGPVLVLWGRLDSIVTEAMAAETARAFRGARLEILEDVGHSAMAEAPGRFVEIVGGFARGLA